MTGKLYFFKSDKPKTAFMDDPAVYSAAGNARWTGWFPDDPYSNMATDCYTST